MSKTCSYPSKIFDTISPNFFLNKSLHMFSGQLLFGNNTEECVLHWLQLALVNSTPLDSKPRQIHSRVDDDDNDGKLHFKK